MSEYQAHLQNRVERAVRNARALVIVDQGFGSMGDPRAVVFCSPADEHPESSALCASQPTPGLCKSHPGDIRRAADWTQTCCGNSWLICNR
jgi:hypothetical protein